MSYRIALLIVSSLLAACTTPSVVPLPDADRITENDISRLQPPPAAMFIQAGDTLRIVRDAQVREVQAPTEREDANLYVVRSDGSFSFPHIGRVDAAGKTPDAIAEYMASKLSTIYRYPGVTVNLATAANNHIFIGGAVKNSAAVELRGPMNVEQAILSAGGVLPSADSKHVALLRMNGNGRYDVYFYNYSALMQPVDGGRAPIPLQRGDIVFVPKSGIGNATEGMDMYVNQLLPFSRSFGVSLNYGNTTSSIR